MSDKTEAESVFEAGMISAYAPTRVVDVAGVPVMLIPGQMQAKLMREAIEYADSRADAPRRCTSKSIHHELQSFIDHINRFQSESSAVWANAAGIGSLMAIYDYDKDGATPRWGDHRSHYSCPASSEWEAWGGFCGVFRSQDAFADFVDENLVDLRSPPDGEDGPKAAEVLEMARNLQIRTKGQFARKVDPTTGEHSMVCKEEHASTSTKIWKRFWIGIPVYRGGEAYRIEVRIKFRLKDGAPLFAAEMHRKDDVIRDAFKQICDAVATNTELPVFVGIP